jgi:hypothetical protein
MKASIRFVCDDDVPPATEWRVYGVSATLRRVTGTVEETDEIGRAHV